MKKIIIKALSVALLAWLLSYTAVPALFDWASVRSLRQSEHFLVSDFYNRIAYNGGPKFRHDNVMCINSTTTSRADIAALLDTLANPEIITPSAVSMDFFFSKPHNNHDDTLLLAAIRHLGSKLVLPVGLDEKRNLVSLSFFDNDEDIKSCGVRYGIANLPGNFFTDVMRSYRPVFVLQDGTRVNSCAVEVIEAAGRKPICRSEEQIIINYPFEQILQVDDTVFMRMARNSDEREALRELVGEAIVFIGTFDDLKDTYQTPIDELMPGVLIHAYAANTLIEGSEVRLTSTWLNKLIAAIITLIVAFFLVWSGRLGSATGASFKLFTCLLIFALLLFGAYYFVAHPEGPLCIMFDRAIKMMVLALLALQIIGFFDWIIQKIKNHKKSKEIKNQK